MIKAIQKLFILFIGASTVTMLLADGRIVYQDDTKVVINCDDNRTSLVIEKESNGYFYEGNFYTTIDEVKKECQKFDSVY